MNTVLLVSTIVSWVLLALIGFLLLGALRAMGVLSWRLEQLEATTPSRLGRDGLKVGKKAPDFTLPCAANAPVVARGVNVIPSVVTRSPRATDNGELSGPETAPQQPEVSLRDFLGRKVLLVFTQSGCGPCKAIAPELNRVHDQGEHQVVVVNNGDLEGPRKWAVETGARFPVLAQDKLSQSKRYQVFAAPFAFLLDEKGIITSKGIIGSRQHLGYVLSGAGNKAKQHHEEPEADGTEKPDAIDNSLSKEVIHV